MNNCIRLLIFLFFNQKIRFNRVIEYVKKNKNHIFKFIKKVLINHPILLIEENINNFRINNWLNPEIAPIKQLIIIIIKFLLKFI